MSVLNLPEPVNWLGGRRRLLWLGTAILFLSSGCAFWAARALWRGYYLTTIGLSGIVVPPLLAMLAVLLVDLGRTSLRASHSGTGTTLRPDRAFSACMYAVFVVAIIGGSVLAVFVPTGTLEFPVTRGWRIITPIVLVPAVVIAARGLFSAYRRGGVGYVRLTPAGLDIANIFSNDIVEWDDIEAITDHSEDQKSRKAAVLTLRDGSEKIIDGLDIYVPEGAGLYWMIRHYWLHPDDRTELVDGRALERLQAGRFDVDETGDSKT